MSSENPCVDQRGTRDLVAYTVAQFRQMVEADTARQMAALRQSACPTRLGLSQIAERKIRITTSSPGRFRANRPVQPNLRKRPKGRPECRGASRLIGNRLATHPATSIQYFAPTLVLFCRVGIDVSELRGAGPQPIAHSHPTVSSVSLPGVGRNVRGQLPGFGEGDFASFSPASGNPHALPQSRPRTRHRGAFFLR